MGRNSGGSWDITHCGVAAVAEDFEAGLGGERLAARDDAVGAVDDGAAGWEAGEGGVVGDWAGGHFGGLRGGGRGGKGGQLLDWRFGGWGWGWVEVQLWGLRPPAPVFGVRCGSGYSSELQDAIFSAVTWSRGELRLR